MELWTEDVWTDGHCHVVCGHFVIWLILHNLFEKFDVKLQCVEVKLR